MLEFNAYHITSVENLEDLVTVVFVIIDDLYKEVVPLEVHQRRHKDRAILSDSEVIAISIIGELLTMDSEKAWLSYVKKNLTNLFPRMCERSRFNRTRRNLVKVIEAIRFRLNAYMDRPDDEIRIIDSFPLPVCEFGRAGFCKSFRTYGANYGVCPSKKQTIYGYKVHALCSTDGYITDFVVAPASMDDKAAVWDLVEQYNRHIYLIGDKGYISPSLLLDLRGEKGIDLIYLKRKNQKNQYPKVFRRLVFKIRRRIETSFSQLSQQLNAEKVMAKSFWGLMSRLHTKFLAFNICFFINQLLGVDNIAKIKSLVF